MSCETNSEFTEHVQTLLSVASRKCIRCEANGGHITLTADLGQHCAEKNCNTRLIVGMLKSAISFSIIPSLCCFDTTLITGISERWMEMLKGLPGEPNGNLLRSCLTVFMANLPNTDDTGETGQT